MSILFYLTKTGSLKPALSTMLAYKDYFRTFKCLNIRDIRKLLSIN